MTAGLSAGKRHKVTVIGSGNWGCTIAKVVAENCKERTDLFEPDVHMWVYEETVKVKKGTKETYQGDDASSNPDVQEHKLSELINSQHVNVKYLPNIDLPHNIIANPDLVDAVRDSTILVFNMPHQFIHRIATQLRGRIVPYARAISCIKGIDVSDRGVRLFSDMIGDELDIYCGALSGANIATEIAQEKWCETTVAYDPPHFDSRHPTPSGTPKKGSPRGSIDLAMTEVKHTLGALNPLSSTPSQPSHGRSGSDRTGVRLTPLPSEYPPLSHTNVKALFHRPYFHVRLVDDVVSVSLGGALKNIVALGAGFVAGLGWGDNAKSAVMRIGLLEEVRFAATFFGNKPHSKVSERTFTEESCGIADIITSSMGGRNFRCAKIAVEDMLKSGAKGIDIQAVEQRELNGQILQGTGTAYEMHSFLEAQGKEADFPLFTAVWMVLEKRMHPKDMPDFLEPRSARL